MNVFVVGGAGFIGSHVCRTFANQGHRVVVFGPPAQEFLLQDLYDSVIRIYGNITDPNSLQESLSECKADIVIQLAAFGAGAAGLAQSAQNSPKQALDINIIGFHNVMEAAQAAGVPKLIWSSSSTVFGPLHRYKESLVDECSMMAPTTLYGSTKVMDELLGDYYRKQFDMEVCGLRLPLIYGPGRWYKGAGGALVDMFEQSNSLEQVTVSGGAEHIDLMYVKDVASAFYNLAVTDHKLSSVYNVKSHTTNLQEMVDVIKAIVPVYKLGLQIQKPATVYPLMDTTRIEQELGYSPQYTVYNACRDYLDDLRRT